MAHHGASCSTSPGRADSKSAGSPRSLAVFPCCVRCRKVWLAIAWSRCAAFSMARVPYIPEPHAVGPISFADALVEHRRPATPRRIERRPRQRRRGCETGNHCRCRPASSCASAASSPSRSARSRSVDFVCTRARMHHQAGARASAEDNGEVFAAVRPHWCHCRRTSDASKAARTW